MSAEEEVRWRQNERHGDLLVQRLSRLVERGYKPVFENSIGQFDLIHSNPKATPVQLWSDGQVVDRYPTTVKDGERTIIFPDDELLFARFLARTPPPTPVQKLLSLTIGEVFTTIAAWTVLMLIIWGLSAISGLLWRALAGS